MSAQGPPPIPEVPAWARQEEYDVRFQWGPLAARSLTGETCVVVDVLRFTTAVEAATARGVAVYPYRWRDDTAAAFADSVHALLVTRHDPVGPSLSPLNMAGLSPGTSLVLPSPNGSTCALLAAEAGARVAAGCLRNAGAVGTWAGAAGGPVTVIACGEKWPDGSLRPSLEDLLGAGAILAHARGKPSPEARAAIAAFRDAERALPEVLSDCASGRELTEKGRGADVRYAARLNSGSTVPVLSDGAFRASARPAGS
ncbi:MAG TPA: 2-phosphosulfolactate phosphatase [Trebonia sp.]|jgi:2-phosphosulfolactate phosphatase|nr:2-phosphosulfolactate phosphatase [Trebonia sp.]